MNFSDDPIFAGAVVLSVVLMLLSMGTFLHVFPKVTACMSRWKTNLEIEDSLQLARSRNWIAVILFVPLCMVVYHYGLYSPDFLDKVPSLWKFPVVVAVMLVYLLFRVFLEYQLEMQNHSSKAFIAANRSFYNFTIVLFFILFLSGAVLGLLIEDQRLVHTLMLVILTAFYALYVFTRRQIFRSVCGPLSTFLYLCGLEFLPTGVLVVSATML